MAIIPTGAIFNTLTFAGVNSGSYGIYITGEAVYNAPERSVEVVSVPGRNGSIMIDQGHWENIEVRYPAGTFAETEADFRANLAAFRNAVVSKLGYQRLSDTYHPDEYRMAVYVSGLEVAPAARNKAGEFTLIFNCKPQRWLTSGEAPSAIAASGNTISNPTLFDSQPLLELEGYGKAGFNGYQCEVFNVPIGSVQISGADSQNSQIYASEVPSWVYEYNKAPFANGDTITIDGLVFFWGVQADDSSDSVNMSGNAGTGVTGVTTARAAASSGSYTRKWVFPELTFTVGTSQTYTHTATPTLAVASSSGSTTLTMQIVHDASAGTITFSVQTSVVIATWNGNNTHKISKQTASISIDSISGISSASSISGKVYIDCEIGEAYTIQGGEAVSLNNSVSIGADLPTLAPGANAITFDNTFTSVKVTPRWWQL